MLLEEVETLIHSAYYVNQNLPADQGRQLCSNAGMYMIIAYTVGLYY